MDDISNYMIVRGPRNMCTRAWHSDPLPQRAKPRTPEGRSLDYTWSVASAFAAKFPAPARTRARAWALSQSDFIRKAFWRGVPKEAAVAMLRRRHANIEGGLR